MATTQSILVIDDDLGLGEFISAAAQHFGYECVVTTNAASFFEELKPGITLVMIDLVMPEVDGVELLRLLAQQNCEVRVVLMSGLGKRVIQTAEQLAKTLGLAVIGHLRKPFRLLELEELFALSGLPMAQKAIKPAPELIVDDADLMAAVERNEFVIHYQPQIDIASGAVIGVEALARWQHPVHGLVYPDAFITRAEALGLVDEIGWRVARRAFSDLQHFADGGVTPTISLNVSVHSLQNLAFPDRMAALAMEYDVAPHNIILEITESGLVRELSSTLEVLARLRMKQIELSIDDFGTGYSMMQQLQTIPATELKIDRNFVQNSNGSSSDRVMLTKTIEIGHELGLRVVAEGVETIEQLDFIQSNGCDVAQGFFFSPALPPAELVEWLRKYRSH